MHRLDHAAQLLATFNVLELDGRPLGDVGLITRRSMVSMDVRTIVVIVLGENFDQVVEMVATKRNEVPKAFLLDTLNYSLDSRV